MAKSINDFMGKRCGLFTDLHIGVHSNSDMWNRIALDYSKWLAEKAQSLELEHLIFLGDFFHNREEVALNTLHTAQQFLSNLSDFKIIMIIGNHDCYYKDRADVHSLAPFKGWPNLFIVDTPQITKFNGKKMAFMPWGFDPKTLDSSETYEYAFGHLEINSFKQTKMKVCDNSHIMASDLTDRIKRTYTGHFHLRSSRKLKNGNFIQYVGNTYQQDWGDAGELKGIQILDFETDEAVFVEYDKCPKHIKISIAKILGGDKEELATLKGSTAGNIIRLMIDGDFPQEKIGILTEKVANLKPLELNCEVGDAAEVKSADDFQSVEMDLRMMLTEYVGTLQTQVADKEKLLNETLSIYDKATTMLKTE